MQQKPGKLEDIKADVQVLLLPLVAGQYTPDWPSIDSRPLPAWYDSAKVTSFSYQLLSQLNSLKILFSYLWPS